MSSAVAAEKKQPTHIDDVSSQIIAPPVDEIITDSLLDVTDSILDPIDQYVSMCYIRVQLEFSATWVENRLEQETSCIDWYLELHMDIWICHMTN